MPGGSDVRIDVHNRCSDFNSYRAARVKSLFNVESGCDFSLSADLPIDDAEWKLGLIVGPSGSGKTSLGRRIFGAEAFYAPNDWPTDRPIIDAIAPAGSFDAVTGALAAVGLGSVPSWLRPFPVLSNGEQFRANLARVICEAPEQVVIDEFTSVVDRQIARTGALSFSKAWKRTAGRCVLLSCHYDIIEWLEPDWVFDTATGKYSGRGLWRRPELRFDLWETDWRYWPAFEVHHYLKLPRMIAASNYIAAIDGEPIAHVAVSPRPGMKDARAARFVVMPEYQGIGIGTRLLNAVAESWLAGENRFGKPMRLTINTSHPGLCGALRRSPLWRQISAKLHGESDNGQRERFKRKGYAAVSHGGHFRAVQGFRYIAAAEKVKAS